VQCVGDHACVGCAESDAARAWACAAACCFERRWTFSACLCVCVCVVVRVLSRRTGFQIRPLCSIIHISPPRLYAVREDQSLNHTSFIHTVLLATFDVKSGSSPWLGLNRDNFRYTQIYRYSHRQHQGVIASASFEAHEGAP